MPIYENQCVKCGHKWEVLQPFAAEPPACPECKAEGTKRLISAPKGVHGGEYNPYDALDRVVPDPKPIKSFANDRRKGGKDTT